MALSKEEKQRLEKLAQELRLTTIDVMAWSGGAHVGGSLSIDRKSTRLNSSH